MWQVKNGALRKIGAELVRSVGINIREAGSSRQIIR